MKEVVGVDTCMDIDECSLVSSCPQQCTNTKGSYKCSCAQGFVSEQRGTVCRALGSDPRILFVTESQIKGINPLTKSHHLYANYTNFAMSFDVNQRTGEIFATIPSINLISVSKVDSIMSEEPKQCNNIVWLEDIGRASLVSVDWVTNNVYYATINSDMVGVCSRNRNCTQLIRSPYPVVTSLALDPLAGRIFISAFKAGFLTNPVGGIWTYGMDGKVEGAHKLSDSKLGVTMGLTVDVHKQRVYWADKNSGMIMSNDYAGSNLMPVFELTRTPAQLAVFQNTLYWLNLDTQQIAMLELTSGTYRVSPETLHITSKSHSIRIIQEQQQPKTENPCSAANCSHLSLLTAGGGCRCECPTGFTATSPDKSMCAKNEGSQPVETTSVSSSDFDGELTDFDGDITKTPLAANHSATITCIVVVCLVLLLSCCLFVFWLKRKSNKSEDMIAFTNSAYGMDGEEGANNNQSTNSKDASRVQVVQRGTIVSCDNPLYADSPNVSNNGGTFGFFQFNSAGPSIAASPQLDFSNIPSLAKGASTPTIRRKEVLDKDSAYDPSYEPSASIDYEDLTEDQDPLSGSFHNDKLQLIKD